MKCVSCTNTKTNVSQTLVHESGGVKRRRKCFDCGVTFSTLEAVLEVGLKKGRPPAPANPNKLYTKEDAALVKKIKTDIRRKNEDTVAKQKAKVSDYYIEDDYDGD